jgi:outer membrane protein OmpA-like peptidoglycan-associated protein
MTDARRTNGAPPREIVIAKKKTSWLPWLLLALAILVAVFSLSRRHGKDEVSTTTTVAAASPAVAPASPAIGVERVTLPGGTGVDLEPKTLNYELQRYLGSNDAAPKTFTFDQLNFDTASSAIRAADRPTLTALGQILSAYPNAKIRLVGYADARGSDPANAKLGQARADSVAQALAGMGVQADRLVTASGGDSDPVGSNATASGQFANRRTELVVTSK